MAGDYLHQVCAVDVARVGGARRDPAKVEALVRSLARNVATEVAITTLAADAGGADGELSRVTVSEYLTVLERLMVIEDQPAWAPHLRSTRQLRSSAKRHFADPSLAVAALRAGPERLLRDLNFFGLLFESLVVRDLRVLSQPLGELGGGGAHAHRGAGDDGHLVLEYGVRHGLVPFVVTVIRSSGEM